MNRRLVIGYLYGHMCWLVRASDPTKVSIGRGWELINPLVPIGPDHGSDLIAAIDGGWIVYSQDLRFLAPADADEEWVLDEAPSRLRWVRVASADPHQPTAVSGASSGPLERSRLPARRLPGTGGALLRNIMPQGGQRVAKRLRPMADALGRESTGGWPVYGELALDAIGAMREGDSRKAILFAAFAIEQMAASRLDAEYDRARARAHRGDEAPGWRWVERDGPKGTKVWKDPVYEALRQRARRSWSSLLVELPLYVWGRSLLDEHRDFYQRVLKLREVRNAISHAGPPAKGDALFHPDDPIAPSRALGVARGVFRWFGEVDYFIVLDADEGAS